MKMVGKTIGQPRKPLTPRSGEIDAALSLLTVMGDGNPKTREWLEDVQASVVHNSALLKDIEHGLAQLGDLERREREVAEVEARADKKLAEIQRIRDSFQAYEKTL